MKLVVVNKNNGSFDAVVVIEGKVDVIKALAKNNTSHSIGWSGSINTLMLEDRENFTEWFQGLAKEYKVKILRDTLEEDIYMMKLVTEAMEYTKGWGTLWYNTPEINNVLVYGAKRGWLLRQSHTQIHWTEEGVELLANHSLIILDKLTEMFTAEKGNEASIKMIESIKQSMITHNAIYKVAVWIHAIGNASTVYLRDELCAEHIELFKDENEWFNAFSHVDSARCRVLFNGEEAAA